MAKRKQSIFDLYRHFIEQMMFLEQSAASFDKGFESEAKRMAATMRVLFHDTRNSHSLLKQLELKDLLFCDFSRPKVEGMAVGWPPSRLVGLGAGPRGARFVPLLGAAWKGNLIPFELWWTEPVYTECSTDENGEPVLMVGAETPTLTRGGLIRCVADQDGGAHVDPSIDEVYAKLSRDNFGGCYSVVDGISKPTTGMAFSSIRQIAHEVLHTLMPENLIRQGAHEQAEGILLAAIDFKKERGEIRAVGNYTLQLASLYKVKGDHEAAEELLHQCIETFTRFGSRDRLADSYGNLGMVMIAKGNLDEAEVMIRKALQIDEEIRRLSCIAAAYGCLAEIYRRRAAESTT